MVADLERQSALRATGRHRLTSEQLIARTNFSYQRRMVDALRAAREALGMSRETLAAELGASVELVRAFEAFEYDLTLTEVRHISLALEAFVEIRVHNKSTSEYSSQLYGELVRLLENSPWRETSNPADIRASWDAESIVQKVFRSSNRLGGQA